MFLFLIVGDETLAWLRPGTSPPFGGGLSHHECQAGVVIAVDRALERPEQKGFVNCWKACVSGRCSYCFCVSKTS